MSMERRIEDLGRRPQPPAEQHEGFTPSADEALAIMTILERTGALEGVLQARAPSALAGPAGTDKRRPS